ncbi:Gfo/Idh/MocA family oxidoreductase [Parabacteroides johnsonii]|uniref:Gfo/Idh/MocA family oxidoreductase n=1 Tax=Parabacteroides johnsonii TaxID=387661 RepID=UPI003AB62A69
MKTINRRDFIKSTGLAAAGIGLSGLNIPLIFANGSPNRKIVVAVAGVNSRGNHLAKLFAQMPDCEIGYICDVDERAMNKTIKGISTLQTRKPKGIKDFRKALEDKGIDVLINAMPDHWHAPGTIIACSMDKHVYVEKPISHNPNEGEMVIKAARKYNRIVQMGSQRRSGSGIIQMISDIRSGIIGNVYMAKTWYTNKRGPLYLKNSPIPNWLDYELWQGPAPRQKYKDGLIHYNWHWRWNWGTGEALNNGTHEVDIARWGLGVEFPKRVSSLGGRYAYKDDWETPDTQNISIEFPENKMIIWENRSCNPFKIEGAERGVLFYGEKGTIYNPGGNSYIVYDKSGNIIKDYKDQSDSSNTTNTVSAGINLDKMHIANFLDCIRLGKSPNADCEIGHRSTLLVQLGNISWRMQETLNLNPSNGHILNPGAEKFWSREYETGWEPQI